MAREIVVCRQKKSAHKGALSPTEKLNQLLLVLEREYAVAGVLRKVDGQTAICICIERPTVKALIRLVVQGESRSVEAPRSARLELVKLPRLTRGSDGIVVRLDKRSVALQVQSAVGKNDRTAIGSLGESGIPRLNRELCRHRLVGIDGQLIRARRILQRVEDSVVGARGEQQWRRRRERQ